MVIFVKIYLITILKHSVKYVLQALKIESIVAIVTSSQGKIVKINKTKTKKEHDYFIEWDVSFKK